MNKPYSPETLAERWGCSAEKIRVMYRNGELAGFRLGKLIRIPATEVERYECQNTLSHDTEESLPSLGVKVDTLIHEELRLERMTPGRLKPLPAGYGSNSTPREATR